MKTLLNGLVVLAMASSLCADTVILQDDFEGGATGTSVSGTNGWTGSSNILFSSTLVDQGQSVDWSGGSSPSWPLISKPFAHTPAAGERYTLTATLYAPDTAGADSEIWIRDASDTSKTIGVFAAYGAYQFGIPDVAQDFAVTPQPLAPVDVKVVLQDGSQSYSYRLHGETAWTDLGSVSRPTFLLSDFDEVVVHGHGNYAGAVDSVSLTAVPEPSTLIVMSIGAIGLVGYAWRKR
jgi:hypothetical protein